MHICVISPVAILGKAGWGGIYTHTKMLLSLLIKRGYKITLIAIDYQNKNYEETIDGIRIIFISGITKRIVEKNWFREVYKIVSKIHKEYPIDCIFSEGYSAYGLQKGLGFKNLPIFTFVHNFHLIHFYNIWRGVEGIRSLFSYLIKTIPRLFFRIFRYEIPFTFNCRYIISVSNLNANYLHKIYRIPKHKIKVIHNWVDTNKFAPNDSFRREYRQRINISDDTLVFLFVGSFWKPKGTRIAIKSFKKFVTYFPNALLMFAGKGPDEDYLSKVISVNESIKKKVHLLGYCGQSELPYLYNCADIFLMPSLLSEGLAYTLIEAMSCGLPSIATRIGGNIELVGDAGILVPLGETKSLTEAMILLAENPKKRNYLSRVARNRIINFFSEAVAEKKLFRLIDEVVAKK